MSFYPRMQATATALITKFGKKITFKRTAGNSIDPVTGAVTAGTTTTYTPPGIFQTIKAEHIDGTVIKQGDKMLVIDGSFEPLITDRVVISTVEWNIVALQAVNPAGVPLTTVVQVRK